MTEDILRRMELMDVPPGSYDEETLYDAVAEIERLRVAIDALLADIDTDHRPEWASDEAEANGKEPWCCASCGVADGGWPCTHRRALDELKEARRG